MTKRQRLDFNSQELTQNLKASTGLGMNAFFTPASPPPPAATTENQPLIKKDEPGQAARFIHTPQPLKPAAPTTLKKTERPERSRGSSRSLQTKPRVRDDYRYIPSQQPYKREIRRHSFEIYKDQVERLQDLKVAMMKTGRLRSMSDMVREALDNFLKKQA